MSLNLKRTKLSVTIYGEAYEMRRPTLDEQAEHESALTDTKDPKKIYSLLKGYVELLGMPSDVAGSMEFEHFQELVKYLSGQKKS